MRAVLPGDDTHPQRRTAALERARRRYEYDYELVPGVAMLRKLSWAELPSLRWLYAAVRIIIKVGWNEIRVGHRFARRRRGYLGPSYELLRWFGSRVFRSIRYLRIIGLRRLARLFRAQDEDLLNRRISGHLPLESETLGKSLNFVFLDEPSGTSEDLDDFRALFQSIELPKLAANHLDDATFAQLRVAGPNPMALRKAQADWAEDFPVTTEMFRQVAGFEDDDLDSAGRENRLYLVDYSLLSAVEGGHNSGRQKFSYAPKALFALTKDQEAAQLHPISIQCAQPAEPGHLFIADGSQAWNVAKTVVNIADTNRHGFVDHLAHTHLILEAFILATNRQLARAHPLALLLRPHLEATAFINLVASVLLLGPKGSVDELFSGSLAANTRVAATAAQDCFNDLMLPRDLELRGVTSPLLDYPYRDDALRLWSAIHGWVAAYVALYYASDDEVVGDRELQAWAQELVSDEGGRIRGFGDGERGQLTTRAYLIEACTMIIFTASVQHAAVNFPQRTIMAYVPLFSMGGYADAPTDPPSAQSKALTSFYPPLETARKQLRELTVLGGLYYKKLGQYPSRHFSDPKVGALLDAFQAELVDIESAITERNRALEARGQAAYTTLLPSAIPMSTSI